MRTRDEVLAYIDEQLDFDIFVQDSLITLGGWYVSDKRRREASAWHYGRVELSNLVDFIYGESTDEASL